LVKLIFLLRRNSTLSTEAFVERYDNVHRLLGEKHVPTAIRYTRRFLSPIDGIFTEAAADFDVITELWFEDQAAMEAAMLHLREPAVAAEIAADEELQFDRSATRVYVIQEEHISTGAIA
jgi:hypothetical protein